MTLPGPNFRGASLLLAFLVSVFVYAGEDVPPREGRAFDGPRPGFRMGGPGPGQPEMKVLKKFDHDRNGFLDGTERKEAREYVKNERASGRGQRRFGPPGGGRGGNDEPAKP